MGWFDSFEVRKDDQKNICTQTHTFANARIRAHTFSLIHTTFHLSQVTRRLRIDSSVMARVCGIRVLLSTLTDT